MCLTQLEKNLVFWLILTESKILITVKISIYFVSPIALKTYQSQYRSKYSVSFTQCFVEGKNFQLYQTFAISNFFTGPAGVRDSGCPL